MNIAEWKKNVLQVEGMWLSDTSEFVKKKLMAIEEEALKNLLF